MKKIIALVLSLLLTSSAYAGPYDHQVTSNIPSLGTVFQNAGDMCFANSLGQPAPLPIGSTGQLLAVVGGFPVWSSAVTFPAAGNVLVSPSGTPTWDLKTNGDLTQQTAGKSIVVTNSTTSLQQPVAVVTAAGTPNALTGVYNNVSTVLSGQAVQLWLAPAPGLGVEEVVRNGGANNLLVYPPTGHLINAGGANTPISIATSGAHIARCDQISATSWICNDSASAS